MQFIKLLLITITNTASAQYFYQHGNEIYGSKTSAPFTFGAGVNLGISPPGKQPGQVALRYDDYMIRFRQVRGLGAHVIRVYALLHPDFYRALLDWNKDHPDWRLYVLHGTAFPEMAMEHDNGTSAYDDYIYSTQVDMIIQTVRGVYGAGTAEYRTGVTGDYTANIAPYLVGWTVGGELSPYCLNRTNHEPQTIYAPRGRYVWADGRANGMEHWVAEMLDVLAAESARLGYMAPITHTNWATTDGLHNPTEPRYPDSVEDWQELDMRHVQFGPSTAGSFYSMHAYGYYPDFIKDDGQGSPDAYMAYIDRLAEAYHDRPLLITETGLPTSIGRSSPEHVHGRHHGGLSEHAQGDLLYDIIKGIDRRTQGLVLFQLHDEWFKKSWNTRDVDIERQRWKNPLTSEQYFGVFAVESYGGMSHGPVIETDDGLVIWGDYEYLHVTGSTGPVIIGEDMDFMVSNDGQVSISSDHDLFRMHYGPWLEPDRMPKTDAEYRAMPATMADFRLLARAPYGNTSADIYTVKLPDPTKIPWSVIGFADPSTCTRYTLGQVGWGRDFEPGFVNGTCSVLVNGEHVFTWTPWTYAQEYYYTVRPKAGFNAVRMAVLESNGHPVRNLTQDELDDLVWTTGPPPVRARVVYWAMILIFIMTLGGSLSNLLSLEYKTTVGSRRLGVINLLICMSAAAGFWLLDFEAVPITAAYVMFLAGIIWEPVLLALAMSTTRWRLLKEPEYEGPEAGASSVKRHAFVVCCHNSSAVIRDTILSLSTQVPVDTIYVSDNGSTKAEHAFTSAICNELGVRYGFLAKGNKTIAQFAALISMDRDVDFVTLVDDDTRLDKTWDVEKVRRHFDGDEAVGALAYPLTAYNPTTELEWFQALEYLTTGYIKLFHTRVFGSTLFASGCFGTFRRHVLIEALLDHDCVYRGDDLQLGLNIHGQNEYRVKCVDDMVATTIVPSCWMHFNGPCDCGNPDLYSQRAKGWSVSAHRFLWKLLATALWPGRGPRSTGVRLLALFEAAVLINEYLMPVFLISLLGMWVADGLLIGIALSMAASLAFTMLVVRRAGFVMPAAVVTIYAAAYKLIMVTVYRYAGLVYAIVTWRPGRQALIRDRLKDEEFRSKVLEVFG
jgi:cellulose synthase/poly-beta-1,6-N-acetylglucosamine synthase-like glycosyltransferase